MGADVSRVRMDPRRDHSGVGIQQGRPLPDADVNELVDILDRRLRTQVADERPAGVARVSKLTPDAFRVTASGGDLTIGRGRMYVDGLLAENHGDRDQPAFDPVLAEPAFDGDIAYADQPYWPQPAALPEGPGPHLVYLDVWSRELTHLSAPDLVEPAIGVDTTTRTQTAWQVRLLPDVGTAATCGSTIDAWDELVAPSGARLTTGTVPVDPEDDPCELPPTGGYRGLENHLYRVEVHEDGRIKWSRDNASIASAVVEFILPTELRLARVRRDDILRFAENDWVEIIDDQHELGPQRGGELRQISVDEATGTISFQPALPDEYTPTATDTVADRHLRVVQWSGVMDAPAAGTPAELEHGITVEFSGTPGRFGDYWVFAARTVDASVEALTAAPPRGVHHHYARLAVVTFPDTASDCRPFDAPPTGGGCSCEVCVTPEQHASGALTIQQAIDQAQAAGGGTIALCPGTYTLSQPLRMADAGSITMRGHGAILIANGTAIIAETISNVTFSDIGIASVGTGPAMMLSNCTLVNVDDLSIAAIGLGDAPDRVGIALAGPHLITAVRRTYIIADIGIAAAPATPDEAKGILSAGLRIEDNTLQCRQRGIDLTGVCVHMGELRIAANTVYGALDAGIAATGLALRGEEVVAGVLTVCGNLVKTNGGVGILTSGRAVVTDNEIVAGVRTRHQDGIRIAAEPPGAEPGHVQVIGNRVIGVGGWGIAVDAPVASLLVKQNVVERAGGGIAVRGPGSKERISIDNNHIIDTTGIDESGASVAGTGTIGSETVATERVASETVGRASVDVDSDDEPTVFIPPIGARTAGVRPTPAAAAGTLTASSVIGIAWGIEVTGGGAVQVAGNLVDGVAAQGSAAGAVGIAVSLSDDVRIGDNTVRRIGAADTGGAIGIGVAETTVAASIQDNVVRLAETGTVDSRPGWRPLVVLGATQEGSPTRVFRAAKVGRIAFDGAWVYLKAPANQGASVQVLGNTVFGGAQAPAVTVDSDGDALVASNRIAQPPDREPPALDLTAPAAVVQGNRATGGRPSVRLKVANLETVVVLGNITSGDITVNDVPLANTPWSPFNPVIP